MSISISEIESYLDKWKDILRLRDWDIELEFIKTPWRKSGDIKIDLDDKKAKLLVNNTPKCTNMEELIIHELLHLKLYAMDQMIEELLNILYGEDENDPKKAFAYGQFMLLLESTVEDLTKGYLSASNSKKPLSFGRLQKEIDKEIK